MLIIQFEWLVLWFLRFYWRCLYVPYECTLDAIILRISLKCCCLTLKWVMRIVNVLNRCWNKYTCIPSWITGFYAKMGPRKLIYTAYHGNVVNKEWLESEVLVGCEICVEGALRTAHRGSCQEILSICTALQCGVKFMCLGLWSNVIGNFWTRILSGVVCSFLKPKIDIRNDMIRPPRYLYYRKIFKHKYR